MIPILCIVDVKHPPLWAEILSGVYWLLIFLGLVVPLANQLFPYIMAVRANGKRPLENERRQTAYEEARAAALQAAEPIKAAQDHRLSVQIRELDGLIATVTEKAEDVRKILRTL